MNPDDDYYAAEAAEHASRLPILAGAVAIVMAAAAGVIAARADAEAASATADSLGKRVAALRDAMADLRRDAVAEPDMKTLRDELAAMRRETSGKLDELRHELGEHDRILHHRSGTAAPPSIPEEPAPPVVREDEAMLDK